MVVHKDTTCTQSGIEGFLQLLFSNICATEVERLIDCQRHQAKRGPFDGLLKGDVANRLALLEKEVCELTTQLAFANAATRSHSYNLTFADTQSLGVQASIWVIQ